MSILHKYLPINLSILAKTSKSLLKSLHPMKLNLLIKSLPNKTTAYAINQIFTD